MKKTIAIGAALLLTLTACATDGSTSSVSKGETDYSSATYRSTSDEKVDVMIKMLSSFPEKPSQRAFLKEFAGVVCDGLDEGVSLEDQVIISMDHDFGYSQMTMGGIFAASIMTHCPEYSYQIDDFREKY